MTSWSELALRHFQHRYDNLILVADPDGLLLEEQMLVTLRGRGFDVLTYYDPVAFRYVYESRYRNHWTADLDAMPALMVRIDRPDIRQLPYDLLQTGRAVALTLNDICPTLVIR